MPIEGNIFRPLQPIEARHAVVRYLWALAVVAISLGATVAFVIASIQSPFGGTAQLFFALAASFSGLGAWYLYRQTRTERQKCQETVDKKIRSREREIGMEYTISGVSISESKSSSNPKPE